MSFSCYFSTVRLIKGNLAIYDHQYRQQKQQSTQNDIEKSDVMHTLRNQRQELAQELKRLNDDNRLVESEIDRLEKYVMDLGNLSNVDQYPCMQVQL